MSIRLPTSISLRFDGCPPARGALATVVPPCLPVAARALATAASPCLPVAARALATVVPPCLPVAARALATAVLLCPRPNLTPTGQAALDDAVDVGLAALPAVLQPDHAADRDALWCCGCDRAAAGRLPRDLLLCILAPVFSEGC